MLSSTYKTLGLAVIIGIISMSCGTPSFKRTNPSEEETDDLEFLGSTASKELYITKHRKASFQFALGFGCPFIYGSERENNLTLVLAAVETLEEVAIIDHYFEMTQSADQNVEPVWTSGIDRLGPVRKWTSTGKDIGNYPTVFQGDWTPGQGSAPSVADYNCVAIWRYCSREGNGPIIPKCNPSPFGTWFTPRPCHEPRRFLCERRI